MDLKIDHIIELTKKYQRILLSISRLEILEEQLVQEKQNQRNLKLKYVEEQQDVTDLVNSPIFSIFNKILKDSSQQLEIEKQEYLVAVLEYNESIKITEALELEIELLSGIVSGEKVVLNTLNQALSKTKYETLFDKSPYLAELKSINKEISSLVRIKIEAEEALEAANLLRATFTELIHNLNKAKNLNNWGKFYHEIQQAKKDKKTHIDKANNTIPIIKKLLFFLKSELNDVEEYQKLFRASQVLLRGFNVEFYTDLINDWINDENLIRTLTSTMTINTQILELKKSLNRLIENADGELPFAIATRNEIIEKIQLG